MWIVYALLAWIGLSVLFGWLWHRHQALANWRDREAERLWMQDQ